MVTRVALVTGSSRGISRAIALHLLAMALGRIVNVASIAGIGTSTTGTTFYAATKAAVITLIRRFALDLGPARGNGERHCSRFHSNRHGCAGRGQLRGGAAKAMMRRVGAPDDIAAAASFLASDQAGFITAQVLTVDGGRTESLGF